MGLNDQYPQQFDNKVKSARNVTFVVVFILVLIVAIMIMAPVIMDLDRENGRLAANVKEQRFNLAAKDADLKKKQSELANADRRIRPLEKQLKDTNSKIDDLKRQNKGLNSQIAELNEQNSAMKEQNALLVRENDHLFISNMLIDDQNDELAARCDSLEKQNIKLADFLGIYISANAPSNASAKFDLDTLMKVFADFQENLSIISEKFAFLQKEADEKEGWSEESYRQTIEKLICISSEIVQLRQNLYKHGLMDIHVYNFTGLFSCLKKRMDARKRTLKAEECEEIMNKLFEFNRNLFGIQKVCN